MKNDLTEFHQVLQAGIAGFEELQKRITRAEPLSLANDAFAAEIRRVDALAQSMMANALELYRTALDTARSELLRSQADQLLSSLTRKVTLQ